MAQVLQLRHFLMSIEVICHKNRLGLIFVTRYLQLGSKLSLDFYCYVAIMIEICIALTYLMHLFR